MVVDDNGHSRMLIRTVLKALAIRAIEEVANGDEALECLRIFDPGLVITDWKMTPMDGLELVRRLRMGGEGANPFVPVIMISGYAESRLLAAARDAGVNEFMAKPISARALMTRVLSVLQTPRPFVRTEGYFGPDGRRRPMFHPGPDRRHGQVSFLSPGSLVALQSVLSFGGTA